VTAHGSEPSFMASGRPGSDSALLLTHLSRIDPEARPVCWIDPESRPGVGHTSITSRLQSRKRLMRPIVQPTSSAPPLCTSQRYAYRTPHYAYHAFIRTRYLSIVTSVAAGPLANLLLVPRGRARWRFHSAQSHVAFVMIH
jgi:hypothetical protein